MYYDPYCKLKIPMTGCNWQFCKFPGEIPDAAFIHAARKKRQMARELGDFIPLDNDPGKGRLVREDENDASDDEDDDEKRRIVFSVKEKSQRQKIAEEIGKISRLSVKLLSCILDVLLA